MPSITITSEQQAALDRGESITVAPTGQPLHNVVLSSKQNRQAAFVWDGEIVGTTIYAYRFQWITDTFGNPDNDHGVELRGRRAFPFSTTERMHVIPVGA